MKSDKTCPKCNGEMEQGNYLGNLTDWQKGDNSFIKERGIKILSFACKRCGFMENYVMRQ